ncbi:MAG: hypothetical protein JWR09_3272 [Mucilaginibacter sp.]|nr:hypothetical protein [Mucilaginibacter sp.]
MSLRAQRGNRTPCTTANASDTPFHSLCVVRDCFVPRNDMMVN